MFASPRETNSYINEALDSSPRHFLFLWTAPPAGYLHLWLGENIKAEDEEHN